MLNEIKWKFKTKLSLFLFNLFELSFRLKRQSNKEKNILNYAKVKKKIKSIMLIQYFILLILI